MASLGKELSRQYDEYGVVQVFDDGEKRYLTFGNHTEQSCMLKRDSARLLYDYTRAMLLPLVFVKNPSRALVLGLGAGALVTCLHRNIQSLRITAVELRQSVVDAAKHFFQLPENGAVQIKVDNASDYLHQQADEAFDLIFSDIYGAEEVDGLQLQEVYLDQCQQHLQPQGWLTLNCWRHHRHNSDVLELLKSRFRFVGACHTQAGNWVLIASNQAPLPSKKILRERSTLWSKKLGFPLPHTQLEIFQSN